VTQCNKAAKHWTLQLFCVVTPHLTNFGKKMECRCQHLYQSTLSTNLPCSASPHSHSSPSCTQSPPCSLTQQTKRVHNMDFPMASTTNHIADYKDNTSVFFNPECDKFQLDLPVATRQLVDTQKTNRSKSAYTEIEYRNGDSMREFGNIH
jgi:hypothetical protein